MRSSGQASWNTLQQGFGGERYSRRRGGELGGHASGGGARRGEELRGICVWPYVVEEKKDASDPPPHHRLSPSSPTATPG